MTQKAYQKEQGDKISGDRDPLEDGQGWRNGGRRSHDPFNARWIGGRAVAVIHRLPGGITSRFPARVIGRSRVGISSIANELPLPEVAVHIVRDRCRPKGDTKQDRRAEDQPAGGPVVDVRKQEDKSGHANPEGDKQTNPQDRSRIERRETRPNRSCNGRKAETRTPCEVTGVRKPCGHGSVRAGWTNRRD